MVDYYKVLEITRTATTADIKKSYVYLCFYKLNQY